MKTKTIIQLCGISIMVGFPLMITSTVELPWFDVLGTSSIGLLAAVMIGRVAYGDDALL